MTSKDKDPAEKPAKAEKAPRPDKGAGGEKAPKGDRPPKGDKAKKGAPEGGEAKAAKPEKPAEPAPPPRLYEFYKKTVRAQLKASRGYPNVNAVPKITKVFTKKGGVLPLPTQMLLTMQKVINEYWWLILGASIASFVAYKMLTSTEKGALWRDTTKLRLPIFGDLFRKQSVARFATTFATLLKSGIQATEALKILCTIVDNKLLAKVLDDVRERIIEGADIATPLKKSRVFPPIVGDMIAIGEESGQLEELLDRIAETYDEEIEVTTAKVTAMIEPLIIVVMAVVVGFIVLAIVMPLVQGFKF